MNSKKTLTEEQKALRAEKARATRAANKARKEQKAKEAAEMLATMKKLALSDELDDQTRANLILEIRRMENAGGYRSGRYRYGLAFGM